MSKVEERSREMRKNFLRHALTVIFALTMLNLAAYDVDNPALVPVTFDKKPVHKNLDLVKDGKLKFAIVTDKKIESSTKRKREKSIAPAVEVLCEAFEKCTGEKPEVFDINELDKAGKYPYMLVVGDNKIVRANGIEPLKLKEQGFAVKTFDKGIIIAGYDSSLIPDYNLNPPDNLGPAKGTEYGAYDFVERFLGVRYFFPGEYGTHWPKIKNLSVSPVSYTDYPRFKNHGLSRWPLIASGYHDKMKKWIPYLGDITVSEVSNWGDRWRMGGTAPRGASHWPFPRPLAKKYPDKLKTIFYTSPNGHFYYNPKAHIGNFYNVLDLKLIDVLMDAYKPGGCAECKGNRVYFGICDTSISPPDVVNNPTVKKYNLITEEDLKRGRGGFMANIYGRFYKNLVERIQKEMPGKKLYILAYYSTQKASLNPKWKMPDGIEINLCDGNLPQKIYNKEAMRDTLKMFSEWYEALGNRPVQYIWTYAGGDKDAFKAMAAGEFVSEIPKVLGKYLGREGDIYVDSMHSWHFYYSMYGSYRCRWNPDWNMRAAIDEHWELFYGKKAAPYLKRFYDIVLKICRERAAMSNPPNFYPLPVVNELEKLLKEAEKAIPKDSMEMKRFKLFAAPWSKTFDAQRVRAGFSLPVYNIHRLLASEKIKLDGNTDESVWEKIPVMPLINPMGATEKPKFPVTVKFAYDAHGIYALMQTDYTVKASQKAGLWANDSYEFFFMPGNKKEVRYQIAFDAIGEQYTSMTRVLPIPQPTDKSWKAGGMQIKNVLQDGKWNCEFFVPFKAFGLKTPDPYSTWFFNLIRNKKSAPPEYSAFSLTLGNNSNMQLYGLIKFAGKGD